MSKIIPMDLIKSMSGKVCSHSDMYFAKRGKTLYTGKRCNPRDLDKDPYTEKELAIQVLLPVRLPSRVERLHRVITQTYV